MIYEKPVITMVLSAAQDVCGGGKPFANVTDGPPHTGTINGYEADE